MADVDGVDKPVEPQRRNGVQSIDRAVALLRCFDGRKPELGDQRAVPLDRPVDQHGAPAAGRDAGEPPGAPDRHQALRAWVGLLLQLANSWAMPRSLREAAMLFMTDLRDEFDETIGLHELLASGQRIVAGQVESHQELRRTYTDIGVPIRLVYGGPGPRTGRGRPRTPRSRSPRACRRSRTARRAGRPSCRAGTKEPRGPRRRSGPPPTSTSGGSGRVSARRPRAGRAGSGSVVIARSADARPATSPGSAMSASRLWSARRGRLPARQPTTGRPAASAFGPRGPVRVRERAERERVRGPVEPADLLDRHRAAHDHAVAEVRRRDPTSDAFRVSAIGTRLAHQPQGGGRLRQRRERLEELEDPLGRRPVRDAEHRGLSAATEVERRPCGDRDIAPRRDERDPLGMRSPIARRSSISPSPATMTPPPIGTRRRSRARAGRMHGPPMVEAARRLVGDRDDWRAHPADPRRDERRGDAVEQDRVRTLDAARSVHAAGSAGIGHGSDVDGSELSSARWSAAAAAIIR